MYSGIKLKKNLDVATLIGAEEQQYGGAKMVKCPALRMSKICIVVPSAGGAPVLSRQIVAEPTLQAGAVFPATISAKGAATHVESAQTSEPEDFVGILRLIAGTQDTGVQTENLMSASEYICYFSDQYAQFNQTIRDSFSGPACHGLALNGETHRLEALLQQQDVGRMLAYSTPSGESAVCAAVSKGWHETVDLLLKEKANVNCRKNNGATPLYVAVQEGADAQMIVRLCKAKADVNLPVRSTGSTPLIEAASRKDDACIIELTVKALLQFDADVNATNAEGGAAISVAAESGGHIDILKLLLSAEADLNHQVKCSKDQRGWTPLGSASAVGQTELVHFLLSAKADIEMSQDEKNSTALHLAAESGEVENMQILLASNACVDHADTNGMAPLHIAASMGHMDVAVCLVEFSASLDVVNSEFKTPLDGAHDAGMQEMVEYLEAHWYP